MAREADTNTIPKRIFQTWKSKTDLPKNYTYWRNTFIEKNPGYHFDLWDDADNRAFIAQNFKWFLRVYDGYPAEIYRADIVRYFYLYVSAASMPTSTRNASGRSTRFLPERELCSAGWEPIRTSLIPFRMPSWRRCRGKNSGSMS